MIIQHNVAALNAYRNKTNNSKGIAKNLEKLSSGYMINRAGDDAAGLAISEKMRAQITGLEQGEKNISDGISLVQTAEGAMAEMCDMMHRLTSLTIQSYNGTYSRGEREMMQQEVDQILKEMDRITESTNFNGIKLLQGNPVVTEEIVVEKGKTYTEMVPKTVNRLLPDWMSVSDKLENNTDNYDGTSTQDVTDGIMKQKVVFQDKTEKKVYFGENRGVIDGYDWAGNHQDVLTELGLTSAEWTPELTDNPRAAISFKGLMDGYDNDMNCAQELYNRLFDLLGCSIGIPCGSCNDEYAGIRFGGSEGGIVAVAGKLVGTDNLHAGGNFNMSEWKPFTLTDANGKSVPASCFDMIRDLIKKHGSGNSTDAQEAEVVALAGDIAEALAKETLKRTQEHMDASGHYDRAIADDTDQYGLIVYDFRDVDKLQDSHNADATIIIEGDAHLEVPVSYFKEGTTLTIQSRHDIEIVCSSYFDDIIPIELPNVSVDALGLTGYNVANYDGVIYSADYRQALDDWENDYTYDIIKRQETYNELVNFQSAIIDIEYIDGEPVEKVIQPAIFDYVTKTREVTYRVKRQDPKPAPGEGDVITGEFVRANITRLEEALDKITSYRGTLGAAQNRMEHALNAVTNYNENLTASESRIRDVDMAKEMMIFTKNNIISQAATAMLSQANMIPQGVLQLLQ